MDRRGFLSLAGTIMVSACHRDEPPRVPSVAWLGGGGNYRERVPDLFRSNGLRPGENLSLSFPDIHPGTGPFDEAQLVAVVQGRPDVLVVLGSPHAVMKQTRDIPIVFYNFSWDPEALGMVQSLRRPGGNVTGATLRQVDALLKQWQLMKEIRPNLRIGGTVSGSGWRERVIGWWGEEHFKVWTREQELISRALNLEITDIEIPADASGAQIARAVERSGAEALMVDFGPGGAVAGWMDFVAKTRIPTCGFGFRKVENGEFLVGWSFDSQECERQVVPMVARILRGEKPGEIPVYLIRNFQFALNRRIARQAGIEIPSTVLVQIAGVFE